jgi:hypothetical protein
MRADVPNAKLTVSAVKAGTTVNGHAAFSCSQLAANSNEQAKQHNEFHTGLSISKSL